MSNGKNITHTMTPVVPHQEWPAVQHELQQQARSKWSSTSQRCSTHASHTRARALSTNHAAGAAPVTIPNLWCQDSHAPACHQLSRSGGLRAGGSLCRCPATATRCPAAQPLPALWPVPCAIGSSGRQVHHASAMPARRPFALVISPARGATPCSRPLSAGATSARCHDHACANLAQGSLWQLSPLLRLCHPAPCSLTTFSMPGEQTPT
jgi:hypothetical protein